jgi:hypothetical protein
LESRAPAHVARQARCFARAGIRAAAIVNAHAEAVICKHDRLNAKYAKEDAKAREE